MVALLAKNLTHTPMARWNLSFIDFQPDWTILDVGCGGGKNIARMLEHIADFTVWPILTGIYFWFLYSSGVIPVCFLK